MEMAEYTKIETARSIICDMCEYLYPDGYCPEKCDLEKCDLEKCDWMEHLKEDAADVAPVVHGRWLCVDTDTEHFFLCNRCKKKEFWESNYCPNCGARMDGDSDAKAD